ncbi:hypothetical protein HC752_06550 [Vibrio sp. S9_S30]|uniref:hypothetical protein n=1 Tax=Vibrio sp. S9_S30 TaxID=2720226 RepID=UPI001681709B|nr:hypothetical protein [Vibrio sp. S9_S30]MBD1556592.1 hypothetical protein [Vibrio sp. S9_S30]
MHNPFNLYVTNAEHQLQRFPLSNEQTLSDEISKTLAESNQPIVLSHQGKSNANALDELFQIFHQLYRPLMRKRGCQVWVHWQQSDDTIIQTGAQTLCQIAAMELAGKKARINFISSEKAMDKNTYLQLLELKGCEYLTAQSVQWNMANRHAL